MSKSDDPAKWLKLGYETYGPAGVRALSQAMGLDDDVHSMIGSGGGSGHSRFAVAYGVAPQSAEEYRKPAQCPPAPPRGQSAWHPYAGFPDVFHCGFEGYLENRDPDPHAPVGECFYDGAGRLVDESHEYAGCRGTPNSNPAWDPRHWTIDPGGILRNLGSLGESWRYKTDRFDEWWDRNSHRAPHPFAIPRSLGQ